MKTVSTSTHLTIAIASIVFSFCVSACNPKEPAPPPDDHHGSTVAINCVQLDSADLAAWVAKGYTRSMKMLLLQTYTPEVKDAGKNNQLLCYPAESLTSILDTTPLKLNVSTVCRTKSISGEVALSSNVQQLANLPILREDGSLKSFSFVRFIPVQNPRFKPYLSYDWEIVLVNSDKSEKVLDASNATMRGSDPCPVYCPRS